MAPVARISLPAQARVDVTLNRHDYLTTVSIVHVGQSALVLCPQLEEHTVEKLLVVTSESAGLMPGGICLGVQDFRSFRADTLRARQSEIPIRLSKTNHHPSSALACDLALVPRRVFSNSHHNYRQELRRLIVSNTPGCSLSPEAVRRRALNFSRHALSGVVSSDELLAMIGAGPGTTPSGDDVIVGVLAGLYTLGLPDRASELSGDISKFLDRTTRASRHYLSAAAENRFGEHVHKLVSSLVRGAPAALTIRQASRWGSSSGIDLLFGLVSTLESFHSSKSNESAA